MSTYEILTLSIGVIGTTLVVIQLFMIRKGFKADHERRQKQATIDHINSIRNQYETIHFKLRDKFGKKVINMDAINEPGKKDIEAFLNTIEHMAVGVNIGVFDLEVVNRAAGLFLITQKHRLYPYIEYARNTFGGRTIYKEYENMCFDIEALRQKRSESGVIQYSKQGKHK